MNSIVQCTFFVLVGLLICFQSCNASDDGLGSTTSTSPRPPPYPSAGIRQSRLVTSSINSNDKSPMSQQALNLASTLLEKTDWNGLYVKMFKMFLNFFMDTVMDRMFGGSLSDRKDVVGLQVPQKGGFLPFPLLRRRMEGRKAGILADVSRQLSPSLVKPTFNYNHPLFADHINRQLNTLRYH